MKCNFINSWYFVSLLLLVQQRPHENTCGCSAMHLATWPCGTAFSGTASQSITVSIWWFEKHKTSTSNLGHCLIVNTHINTSSIDLMLKKLLNVQSTLNRKNSRCSNFISKRNDLLQLVLHWAIFSAIYRLNVGNIVTLWIRSLNNCCKKKATILDESQGVLL